MFTKLLSILSAVLIVVSMSWQTFAELKELDTALHLIAFSEQNDRDHDHDSSDVDHDSDDHHHDDDVASQHTHKHRHSPNEPEHEHTHTDLSFLVTFASLTFAPSNSFDSIKFVPSFEMKFLSNELLPSSWVLSSLLRPPIA